MNKTIKIFLASSEEMLIHRSAFKSFLNEENKHLQKKNIFLEIGVCDDFIDAMSVTRLQDEYNKLIEKCDIFIMLFRTKVGKYISEEFERAFKQFQKTNRPLIYTYFNNVEIKISFLSQTNLNSLWKFQRKLSKLGHFQTEYETTDSLSLHFKKQLDKLFQEGLLPNEISDIPKWLSAAQPSVPRGFLGRDIELLDIRIKLEQYHTLLINAEGGMGKTTLAARYLSDNKQKYKHCGWLFCDNGIIGQIKTLAIPLKVDLTLYESEDAQLLALKTAMQNLPEDCLLILDNANDQDQIDIFQEHFRGLPWHVLMTSRCQKVLLKENEYHLNPLKAEQAKTLFKRYYDEDTVEFEALLEKFLEAVGYNTLVIELYSKNIYEYSATGETFANVMEEFEKRGIFLGEKSFEIKTDYPKNVQKKGNTLDQILEVLYDFTKLEEAERNIIVNIALLPSEDHLLPLLLDLLTTPDYKISFLRKLNILAQKGWVKTDTKSYRLNVVLQKIVIAKNKNSLLDDSRLLVSNLIKKLNSDNISFDTENFMLIQPYAEIANSVTSFLHFETLEIALLLLNLSDYYKSHGNFKMALEKLNTAIEIFEKIDNEYYKLCLKRQEDIYHQQGDLNSSTNL